MIVNLTPSTTYLADRLTDALDAVEDADAYLDDEFLELITPAALTTIRNLLERVEDKRCWLSSERR